MLPEPRQSVEIAVGIRSIVSGRVIFARGNSLVVHIDDDVSEVRHSAGVPSVVMYGQPGGHYWLRGSIRSVSGRVMAIDWEGTPEHFQRREHDRVPITVAVTVRRADGGQEARHETHDLSGGGLRLHANAGFEVDDEVELEMELPDGRPPVAARARVVRRRDESIGLVFEHVSAPDRDRLLLLPEPRQRIEIQIGPAVFPGELLAVRTETLTVRADHDCWALERALGEPAVVLYGRTGGHYHQRGTVETVHGRELTVRCEGEPERNQRRDHVRMPIRVPVRIASDVAGIQAPCETRDISGGGLWLSGGRGLRIDDVLTVELALPDGRPPVPARARVVRVDAEGVSLTFGRIAEGHRDRMIKLVFESQRKAAGARSR